MKNHVKFIIVSYIFIFNLNSTLSEDYYSKTGLFNKILKMNDNEYLFYGSNGGILRTYDNCQTWKQEYSGTNSYIPKMVFFDNNIYGITFDGQFMESKDKGEFWNYQKLSNGFSDICYLSNNIIISTFSDTLLISSNLGNNWEKYISNTDSILNVATFNNNLFLNTTSNKLYKSNLDNIDFKVFPTPFIYNHFKEKNNEMFIYSNNQIAKLSENEEWIVYDIGLFRAFNFINLQDSIVLFSPILNSDMDVGLEIYGYNKSSKELNLITKYFDNSLSSSRINNLEYFPLDVDFSNGEFLLSNYFKTIIKSKDLLNWEIKSISLFTTNTNIFVYDKNNYFLAKQNKSSFIESNNGGKTFKMLANQVKFDSYDRTYYPIPQSLNFVDSNNALIVYYKDAYSQNNSISGNLKHLAMYDFSTKSINEIDIDITSYSNINNLVSSYVYYGDTLNNNFILYTYNHYRKKERVNNFPVDSIYKLKFFGINGKSVEELGEINDSIRQVKIFRDNNINWVYANGTIMNNQKNNISKIYKSIDGFQTFELVIQFESENSIYLTRDLLNNYYIINNSEIYILNSKFELIDTIQTNFKYVYPEKDDNHLIENQIFIGASEQKIVGNKIIQEKFRFQFKNNKIVIFEEILDNRSYVHSFNDNTSVYLKYNGYAVDIFFPIEDDKKAYYLKVESPTPPSIWTYPPYPNPVKDRLKTKFYSAIMGQIANLKVELIEIGSGRVYNINDYKLSKTDDYFGEIDINISSYNSGAYLINFKLGESNKSESIIIE